MKTMRAIDIKAENTWVQKKKVVLCPVIELCSLGQDLVKPQQQQMSITFKLLSLKICKLYV